MEYYISERARSGDEGGTAWTKARRDAERICESEGFSLLPLSAPEGDRENAGFWGKLRGHFAAGRSWRACFAALRPGDTLFLQLPVVNNCFYLARLVRGLRRQGVRVLALVHDLESLRMGADARVGLRTRLRMRVEERGVLLQCDRLIVHNGRMLRYLAARGVPEGHMTALGLFDYLVDEGTERAVSHRTAPGRRDRLIVAGNLSPEKAGYLYALPETVRIDLYGVRFAPEGAPGCRYMGAFAADELPAALDGGWGLVWDGPSPETCGGVYGQYLRVNAPHKLSLYLAAGLPVMIWEEAALAELVRREGVGVTVRSVAEAARTAAAMPETEYAQYRQNAAALGQKLREGRFLRAALRGASDI